MQNFQTSSEIKLGNQGIDFLSMNYDASEFIILRHTLLTYYRKVGKSYKIQQEMHNFISNWDIYDLILHPYEKFLGVIHKSNFKVCYTGLRFSQKKNKWLIYYNCQLLDVDNSLFFPLTFHLNPILNLINTTCNQALLEDQIGLFLLQVRQNTKKLRKYQIQGERIKYFDQKKLIISICHKKIFIYKYYHFQPLHVYNAKCNIFDIIFNDQGLIFIFCSSGLIIWDLNVQKRQQTIQLDPILKNLSDQLQLYYLQGVIIFSTNDKTFYQLTLDGNKNEKPIKLTKEFPKFLSNSKGNIFFLLEYHQSTAKSNKLRVYEQL
ncbi:unnamed protein product [Paramecium sonneborni]|uniref:Uncharacterized protein n=1 Tax=Paramecium sonneborni TaxID=65129 RepID=A0A8S1R5F9_9CILI|nr:unnamed protein product [Paramecium sonneborni]